MKKLKAFNIAAIFLALLGSIVEGWHTYHVILLMSDLQGWEKLAQAIIMAIFVSGGLFYFVIRSNFVEGISKEMKYTATINLFKGISIVINLFYWLSSLLFDPLITISESGIVMYDWSKPDYVALLLAVPFAIIIPVIISRYANEIVLENVEFEKEKQYTMELLWSSKDKKTHKVKLK